MAQLIYRSPYLTNADEVQIAWEGTPSQRLAASLDFFEQAAAESHKRILANPDAPEAVVNVILQAQAEGKKGSYTVVPQADGSYSIWISDGPERYDLVA